MKQFRFQKFKVYQDALRFRRIVKDVIKNHFPSDERFQLTAQLMRAVNSIILNIAEGSARSTDKDFANFLNISVASVHECVACLDIAHFDSYISSETHKELVTKCGLLANQLTAFRKKLLESKVKR